MLLAWEGTKCHRGVANHESEETPIPPSVEEVAGQEKENILGAAIEARVLQHHGYQEEETSRGVKEHGVKLNRARRQVKSMLHVFGGEPHAHKDIETHVEETIS